MQVLKLFLAFGLFVGIANASYAPVPLGDINSQNMEVMVSEQIAGLIPSKKVYLRSEVLAMVTLQAEKHGVSLEKMMYTIEAESHFHNVQSNCHKSATTNCGNEGVREESYGIAQFHISTFPKYKALDPYLAVEEMARLFAKGEACRWAEYKNKYGCQ